MQDQGKQSKPPGSKPNRASDPTPEEIAVRCLEIQEKWSETERAERGSPIHVDEDIDSNLPAVKWDF